MAPKEAVVGPRCSPGQASRKSFAAAADLVVKPSTPPKSTYRGVANASVAGSHAHGSKAEAKLDIAGIAIRLASPPQGNSMKVHAAETKQEEGVSEEAIVVELGRQALVEVRGLSGDAIVKAKFSLSDAVLSVKQKVLKTRSIPLWQQMLSFQGDMLDDQSTLGELNLSQDAVFDLVIKSGPSPEDMEALADVASKTLTDGIKGMNTLTKSHITEVRAFSKPPPACEQVCVAALHMLAGLAPEIPVKRNGSPKNADWSGCQLMMRNPTGFVNHVLELPLCIDQGKVKEEQVEKCRQLIHSIQGDSESEKIRYVARCSLMCQQLITFLFGAVKYYDSVADFRERFGGATITELKSQQ